MTSQHSHDPVVTRLGDFRPLYQVSCACGWYAGLYSSALAGKEDVAEHAAVEVVKR